MKVLTFKTAVTEAVSAVTVQFAGYQCDYSGTIAIANAKLVEPENVEVKPTDPTTVASFQENIKGWESEAGWNYSHGKENPVKNDTTPTETARCSHGMRHRKVLRCHLIIQRILELDGVRQKLRVL